MAKIKKTTKESITIPDNEKANDFYREALLYLQDTGHRFLVGGAFSFFLHTGIYKATKDLDIFCIAGELPYLFNALSQKGYKTEVRDRRWLAKAYKGDHFIDIIFNSPNGQCVVDETWFELSLKETLEGVQVNFLSAEDLCWCKIYVQNRERYDGSDINHLFLKKGKEMNWKRLLKRMNIHWQLLLGQIMNFFFVYPGHQDHIPQWLFDDLIERAKTDYMLPPSVENICRGPLITHSQYNIDIFEWKFKNY